MEQGVNDLLVVGGLGVTALLVYWLWDYLDFAEGFRMFMGRRDSSGRFRKGMTPDDVVKKFTRDADNPYDGRPD
jgi:hypothetical protein